MASGGAEGGSTSNNRTPRPITERFRTAVAMIRTLPKEGPYMADNKTKLRFYALYKQATEGPCAAPKPGFWDVVGKAKWEAWSLCGNMSKEIAMQLYVDELTEVYLYGVTWPQYMMVHSIIITHTF
ncbi:Acyl-CoA-binding domain-containing protein 5 [Geodia barretti]|uniref:Acyl-CoA-binding domain-containing protein 5 n=1 Tax=Geodia barretti TaxID=519541 RepID=A0AA35RB19_GEOBA|nr:Acyl-CoA-binding domain-containing protein 5 [Geodia barretti]